VGVWLPRDVVTYESWSLDQSGCFHFCFSLQAYNPFITRGKITELANIPGHNPLETLEVLIMDSKKQMLVLYG